MCTDKTFLGEGGGRGGGEQRLPEKVFFNKNMLRIRSMINILPVAFTCIAMIFKSVTFLCKTINTCWYTINQEYKAIVNGLIKTI